MINVIRQGTQATINLAASQIPPDTAPQTALAPMPLVSQPAQAVGRPLQPNIAVAGEQQVRQDNQQRINPHVLPGAHLGHQSGFAYMR